MRFFGWQVSWLTVSRPVPFPNPRGSVVSTRQSAYSCGGSHGIGPELGRPHHVPFSSSLTQSWEEPSALFVRERMNVVNLVQNNQLAPCIDQAEHRQRSARLNSNKKPGSRWVGLSTKFLQNGDVCSPAPLTHKRRLELECGGYRFRASSSSIALTLPAERPLTSKSSVFLKKVSAIDLANSAPITRAPMVMIWALLDSAARSAE